MKSIETVLELMAALRAPDSGSAWNQGQDFHSIAPYTIEEAYEVADAIDRGDMDDLCNELGDLLFQVVYHSRIAEEKNHFTFPDVVAALCNKIRIRNPEVFGESRKAENTTTTWEEFKVREQQAASSGTRPGILEGISRNLPALRHAQKLQSRAAVAGFDWNNIQPVLEKLEEEIAELKEAIETGTDLQEVQSELGDLLFCCVNLARHLEFDAETCLRMSNHKFAGRFRYIEQRLTLQGKGFDKASLEEMDKLWEEAKQAGY